MKRPPQPEELKMELSADNSFALLKSDWAKADPLFMSVEEAADFLRIQKSTLYSWVHQRRIPFRKHGRRLAFVRAALEEWSAKYSVPEREP